MKHQRVDLSKLVASDQPRPLITADVDKLAASIKDVGLIQPITVKPRAIMSGGLAAQGFQIVAGHHRVAACRALGWAEIDAIVIEVGEHLQAELIEIDENLCRSELTAAQRSKAVKRRKEIWEALHPVIKQRVEVVADAVPVKANELEVGDVFPPQVSGHGGARPQNKSFASSTAAVTGESKRSINQHIARAEALGDDLDKVAGTSLDKGVELDALKAMPPAARAPLIERAQAGENVSARKQPAAAPKHTTTSLIKALRASFQHLLDATGCATADEVVTLICDTFGAEHEHDVALHHALEGYCAVGYLEPPMAHGAMK
jgi:hypothetical protein